MTTETPPHDLSGQAPSGQEETFTAKLRRLLAIPIDTIAHFLHKLGVSPNAITLTSFLISVGAAYLVSQGQFFAGGLVFIFGTALDGLDGAVARAGGNVTKFGGLLDSTLDRYGEGALLTALGYYMAVEGQLLNLILIFLALIGSVMVSYIRARSEGLGIENKVGLLTRVERIIITTLMLLTGQVVIGLWILAIFTQVTVGQRMWVVYQASKTEQVQG